MKKSQTLNLIKMERDASASVSPEKIKKEKAARNAGGQADANIDQCSVDSEHEMPSELFDFHKLMEMDDFGVKRYNNFVYKGQIDKNGHREGFGV